MRTMDRRTLAMAALATVLATGCGEETTGPGDAPFDPGPATAAVEALAEEISALDESWRSLELAADPLDAAAMRDLLPEPRGRLVPDTAAAWRFVLGLGGPAKFFPPALKGVTLTWDPGGGRYVPTASADAPVDGLRVVRYVADPTTGVPAQPLQPDGWVELRDVSGDGSEGLDVEVADGGTDPVARYRVTATLEFLSDALVVHFRSQGSVSGAPALGFDLIHELTLSDDLAFRYDDRITTGDGAIDVRHQARFSGEAGEGSTIRESRVGVTAGPETLEIERTFFGDATGVVRHGGSVVAVVGGTEGEPTFSAPDGSALDAHAGEGLRKLLQTVRSMLAAG